MHGLFFAPSFPRCLQLLLRPKYGSPSYCESLSWRCRSTLTLSFESFPHGRPWALRVSSALTTSARMANTRSLRAGARVLRHVHLPPESNPADLEMWERRWKRGSRNTSDTALVYAFDPEKGYLLIYIAREPGIYWRRWPLRKQKQLMEQFADVAEAFIHEGTVLI